MSSFARYVADFVGSPFSPFWLDTALKATVLLLAAIGATALLRRQSAALRHRLWCLTFAALVMLPGLSAAVPEWRLPVLPHRSPFVPREESRMPPPRQEATIVVEPAFAGDILAAPEDEVTLLGEAQPPVLPTVAPAAPRFRLSLISLWLGGALLAVSPLAVGLLRTLQLRRKARTIDDTSWIGLLKELRGRLRLARRVELIETEAAMMPMTWGLRRPVVLLPRQAREWPDRLRRIVLLHELAHIKRCDAAFQTLARLACALYWFHPLAWYGLRRLRIERELACDDCVVHTGERASDYAAELLHVARSYRPIRFAAAVAMAQRNNLEHRLRSLFDRARSHLPLGARGARLLLACVMVLSTTIAAVRLAPRAAAGDNGPTDKPDSVPSESADDLVTVNGCVVDPAGKPFAGARVLAVAWYWPRFLAHLPLAETESDERGRFNISFAKLPSDAIDQRQNATIVATADGFGPGWIRRQDIPAGTEPTLKLATDDLPITGRVVDLEGKPLAGVTVQVGQINSPQNGSLDGWLAAVRRGELPWTAAKYTENSLPIIDTWSPRDVTTSEGTFRLSGIGRERVVHLSLQGPTIAYCRALAVTRNSASLLRRSISFARQAETVYGADFELVAQPTQPIEGIVRAADTGLPLAGVGIESDTFADRRVSGDRTLRAITDETGYYRLVGMPKGTGNRILAVPTGDQPFLMRELDVPESRGLAPVQVDFDLHRGIWIKGRVTDKTTGKPLIARVHYLPFRTNESARSRPEFAETGNGHGYQDRYSSGADGSYRIVGLPGRAIVGAHCLFGRYRHGVGAEVIEGMNKDGYFETFHNPGHPGTKWPDAMKEINPPPGMEPVVCDLALDPGEMMTVALIDPAHKPLGGFEIDGRCAEEERQTPIETTTVEIINLGGDETRTLVLRHKKRNLGKVVRLRLADHPNRSMTVMLEPSAKIVGQLVDSKGDPLSGAAITAWVHPLEDFSKRLPPAIADEQGRFEYTGIPTGCHYDLDAEAAGIRGWIANEITLLPGETKELGELTVGGEKKVQKKQAAKPAAGANEAQIVTFRGSVLDPAGKPLAGAKLYLSYANQDARKPRLLGAAGDDGRFRFEIDNAELDESLAFDARAGANIAAVAEGFGLQWLDLDQRDDNGEYTLRLVNDVPIHGRIVDVDGQGIAGAKLRLRQIAVPANGLDAYIEATRNGSVFVFDRTRDSLPGTPDEIALDPDGRFTLHGVGAERVLEILVEGPSIEWWYIKVMSRNTDAVLVGHGVPGTPVLPRPDRVYGADFGHVAPPSRLIVGTLRDGESGKPIAGVKVQSRGLYSSMHLPKTDEEGRFELLGHPKAPQYELLAVPDGLPYFEGIIKIQDTPGLEPLTAEMALLRGTEAQGRMTFEPDGQPGPGTVEYHPLRPNSDAVKIVPRAAQRPLSTAAIGADGRYRLPVLPGPGVLAFRAHGLRRLLYAPAYIGRDDLEKFFHDGQDHGDERVLQTESGRPGPTPIFQTNYNRLILINPPQRAELLETDVTIESGRTAKGIVYDPDDQPLTGAMVSGLGGRQGIGDVRLDTPAFTVAAIHPRRTRELVFRHPGKQWGKFCLVPGNQVDVLHVRLEDCGEAEGRLLDAEGMPLARASISVSRANHAPTMTVETDDRGIFRIDNLIPGLKYNLYLLKPSRRFGQPRAIQTDIVVAAGERKALGDVGVNARLDAPSKAAER